MSYSEILGQLESYITNAFNLRYDQQYSEDSVARWVGINDRICPMNVPATSDCSSFVTWIYWTMFGNGPDILNGEGWSAGYTGTLWDHGTLVSDGNFVVGDICIYGTSYPFDHAAIYLGGGYVISHGTDSDSAANWKVGVNDFGSGLPLAGCRRYVI